MSYLLPAKPVWRGLHRTTTGMSSHLLVAFCVHDLMMTMADRGEKITDVQS